MPRRNPATPLPDSAQEAYAQVRAQGVGPAQAAQRTGLQGYRNLERQRAFQERLKELSGEASDEPGVTLHWLVSELKRTVSGARVAGQYKNANEALSQLAELYERHPELRGDSAKKETPVVPATREERRAAHRGRLAVVPEAAHE